MKDNLSAVEEKLLEWSRGGGGRRGRRRRAEVVDPGQFEGCCGSRQEELEQHQNCSLSQDPSPQPALSPGGGGVWVSGRVRDRSCQ